MCQAVIKASFGYMRCGTRPPAGEQPRPAQEGPTNLGSRVDACDKPTCRHKLVAFTASEHDGVTSGCFWQNQRGVLSQEPSQRSKKEPAFDQKVNIVTFLSFCRLHRKTCRNMEKAVFGLWFEICAVVFVENRKRKQNHMRPCMHVQIQSWASAYTCQ